MYFYPFNDTGFGNHLIGDVNNDDIVNIYDVILIIEYILFGSISPNSSLYYMNVADQNNQLQIDVADVLAVINIILNSM